MYEGHFKKQKQNNNNIEEHQRGEGSCDQGLQQEQSPQMRHGTPEKSTLVSLDI